LKDQTCMSTAHPSTYAFSVRIACSWQQEIILVLGASE
jgi:hypothetical protein